jgi:uncharacterized protein (DUF1501 family)
MPLTRRRLLNGGALLVASGFLAPSFVTRTALALDQAKAQAQASAKILVVLQLSGGNDGLNTVVPFADPGYAQLRPSLGVADQALRLTDQLGLHPNLAKVKDLYDQGKVAVVQGVGYPNPNRSHFRSMDIWHTAHPESFERSGWLGRYVDACQCGQEPGAMPAISVGDQLNGLFWTETTLVPAVASIGAFSFLTDTKYKNDRTFQLQALHSIYSQAGTFSPYETLIRKGTLSALAGSDELQRLAAAYKTPIDYPANNGLANQLKLVAQVIAGDVGTRLFSVSMGGFDTHANQKDHHATLLGQMGDAIDAFMRDLATINRQDDVVLMTFSEFGRRARQNGSQGTDHGTAEPMFVIGNRVHGGLYGTYPSLEDLDPNGDLKYSADFRSVYAGVLKDWVGTDPTPVLGGSFDPIEVIRA